MEYIVYILVFLGEMCLYGLLFLLFGWVLCVRIMFIFLGMIILKICFFVYKGLGLRMVGCISLLF